jgi:hypothetical protein
MFHYTLTVIMGTLQEDEYTLNITSRPILGMRKFSDKSCRENQSINFMFNNFLFFENRAVYEIMWKNIVGPDKPQMTIWRIAC